MSDGTGRPAAHAITPPRDSSEGAVSTARLMTPMAERVPESVGGSAEADWASFGTAPTLLLTPPGPASGENASPSPAMTRTLEEQPWFRTGTTVAPPSLRPPAESVAPSPVRHPPNPRVLKIVAGVIAGCLLIVAVAGAKLLYLRIRGPVATPAPTAQTTAPAAHAVVAPASPTPSAPERPQGNLDEAAAPTTAPSSARASPPAPVTRTPTRSSTAPARTTKPSTRRAPVTKKVGRSH